MKKYIFSIMAVIIAVGLVAFSELKENNKQSYHWYKRIATDTYSPDGVGAEPMTSCPGGGVICAKGFSSAQDTTSIKDTTYAPELRHKLTQ